MGKFSANLTTNDIEIILELTGEIGYESKLPTIVPKNKVLKIDMTQVKSINSFGINIWKGWIIENCEINQIIMVGVPWFFIRQIQNFNNLVPPNAEIRSFYVPFFCPETDEQKEVLFSEGVEYKRGEFLKIPQVLGTDNKVMEPDVDVKRFFAFLNANLISS